ncbi:MAG: extracellular solute-binding protein [Treponema sp.]|jgi:ABC-type glycerol-3-phosphate transport system substrate-binding protein|nr:extracellular solute-binding protein [Treponema sp.]
MNKSLKSLLMFFLALCVVSGLWAGGGQPGGASSGSGGIQKTLKIVGCGPFATTGLNGTIDAISGRDIPGYKMIVDEWKRLQPDVSPVIEAYPWDNWQAAIQTAVLAGGVDVIMHGATLTDLAVPLNDRVKGDAAWASKRLSYATRRADVLGPLNNSYITGIPVAIAPMVVLLNKDILAHYNVKLPDANWTWDELLAIAKATTGTDPVTKEKTYGFQFHMSYSNNEIWKNFVNIGYGLGAVPLVQYGANAKSTKVTYNDANAMKIWDFVAELSKYTSPSDREGIDVSVPQGDLDIAIYFSEDAILTHDNLKAAGVLDKYAVQSLPRVNSGELRGDITPYLGDFNLAICKTSTQQDLAWEWIKFSTTNEVAIRYYTQAGRPPNHRDYYSNINQLVSQSWVDAIGRGIAKIPDTYSPASGLYSNNISFGNLNATIGQGIRMLLMGTGSAKDAADSVQKMVDEYKATLK